MTSHPLKNLLSEEEYAKYKEQLSGKPDSEQDIQQLILESSALVYAMTAEATNKRWPFEAEIKRPYFHVKPLDTAQLVNWRRYLDFEETEGDVNRIRLLYERCLVPCVIYSL